MQILDPGKIKDEKKKTEQEIQARILALQHEEAAANRRVNDLHEVEKREKARIAAEAEKGIPELETQKAILINVINVLEARRVEAMKPVEELKKQAQAQIDDNQKQTRLLEVRQTALNEAHELLLERIDHQSEVESEIKDRLQAVERAEKAIIASQSELKRSTEELSTKWVSYHTEVMKINAEVAKKTAENEVISQANKIRADELYKIAAGQLDHERAIQDKYKTLQSAVDEARKTLGIKI